MEVIYITTEEKAQLDQLDVEWDEISTAQGVFRYYMILGVGRADKLIDALCKKEKLKAIVI